MSHPTSVRSILSAFGRKCSANRWSVSTAAGKGFHSANRFCADHWIPFNESDAARRLFEERYVNARRSYPSLIGKREWFRIAESSFFPDLIHGWMTMMDKLRRRRYEVTKFRQRPLAPTLAPSKKPTKLLVSSWPPTVSLFPTQPL